MKVTSLLTIGVLAGCAAHGGPADHESPLQPASKAMMRDAEKAVVAASYDANRFSVEDCREVLVPIADKEDCEGDDFMRLMHCAIVDSVTGCIVGAQLKRNPNKADSNVADWTKADYAYSRLFNWECPPGVAPPSARDFRFDTVLKALPSCDATTGEPRSLFLRRRETAKPD
jgi:hypothetical protein